MISKAAIPAFHALLVHDLYEPFFDPHWHFHPEYQLFVVLEGTGTRFIGDHVQRFGPGDLVLTGPNLPHVWHNDATYFNRCSAQMTHGIVVYFRDVIFGQNLLETQEAFVIKQLLKRSEQGLSFHGKTEQWTTAALGNLTRTGGFECLLGLFQILHRLSISQEYEVLSRMAFSNPLRPADRERMRKVISYLMGNFTEPIHLKEIAAIANMSSTAFCRYFKQRTNKTLSQFVAEIRIGYACKLITQEDLSISQVAYESGYCTISNFNRQFKALSGLTPSEYKQKYVELLTEPLTLMDDRTTVTNVSFHSKTHSSYSTHQ